MEQKFWRKQAFLLLFLSLNRNFVAQLDNCTPKNNTDNEKVSLQRIACTRNN